MRRLPAPIHPPASSPPTHPPTPCRSCSPATTSPRPPTTSYASCTTRDCCCAASHRHACFLLASSQGCCRVRVEGLLRTRTHTNKHALPLTANQLNRTWTLWSATQACPHTLHTHLSPTATPTNTNTHAEHRLAGARGRPARRRRCGRPRQLRLCKLHPLRHAARRGVRAGGGVQAGGQPLLLQEEGV